MRSLWLDKLSNTQQIFQLQISLFLAVKRPNRLLRCTRVSMQAFAGNYSHDNRFSKTQWKCRCDTSIENEAHLIEGFCPVYGIVREKYDNLENDENLIKMFNEILSMRENLEEEERKEEMRGRRRRKGGRRRRRGRRLGWQSLYCHWQCSSKPVRALDSPVWGLQ